MYTVDLEYLLDHQEPEEVLKTLGGDRDWYMLMVNSDNMFRMLHEHESLIRELQELGFMFCMDITPFPSKGIKKKTKTRRSN